jgi:hypothetical protein
MYRHLLLLACLSARMLLGWGCEGHQIVALIAEANLSPHAAEQVRQILTRNPIDPATIRFCLDNRDDPMADASTWADDARRTDGGARWHYIDIPRQATEGDPNQWCQPIGPAVTKGDRDGCVLTAIAYFRGKLANPQTPPPERAAALRYLIHFVGDLHQPLHAADNHDNGGNCAPMALPGATTISNLHSIWDTGLIEQHLKDVNETARQYAAALNKRFQEKRAEWSAGDVNSWAWQSHGLANSVVYGALQPQIPVEPATGRTDCNAESAKVYELRISPGREYSAKAIPVIDEQLTRAGYRLAAMLNAIWP